MEELLEEVLQKAIVAIPEGILGKINGVIFGVFGESHNKRNFWTIFVGIL